MKKKISAIAAAFVLSAGLGMSDTVFAQGEKEVGRFKTWKVSFTEKVNIDSVHNNIYVVDEQGNKTYLESGLEQGGDTILLMPPKSGYDSGEVYTLKIEKGIKSISGGSLSQGKSLKFRVKGEVEENYDPATVNLVQYDFQDNILTVTSGYMVDDLIISKLDILKEATRIEVAYSNGDKTTVKNIVNWDKKNGLITIKNSNRKFKTLMKKNSAQMNWLGNKLGVDDPATLYYGLIQKELYSLADVREILYDDSSLSDVINRVNQYYGSEDLSGQKVQVERIFMTKQSDEKKIKVYISFDEGNSLNILNALDNSVEHKEQIKAWTARIGNYVKGRFPDYIVESNVMTVVQFNDVIRFFSPDEMYYDISTRRYYPKTPVLKHVNVNSKDYFIEK